MRGFIKRYYFVMIVALVVVSFVTYQFIFMIGSTYILRTSSNYNAFLDGPTPISIYLGTIGDKGKCDSLNQVKRGVQPGNLPDKAVRKLFDGPLFSEELSISSAFKGYDEIYNGMKLVDGAAYVDFKSDIIDPNSSFYKDFKSPCVVAQLNQLVFTVKQFKEVENVVIAIDGSPQKFMQARQINCDMATIRARFESECLKQIP